MRNSPLLSLAIRYGLIAAVVAFGLLLGTFYVVGHHPFMIAPFLDFRIVLFALFIFFCLKEYRDYQNGVLYFWQGMIAGFVIVIIAGTIASIMVYAFCYFEKDFIPSYVESMTTYLKTFPADEIERIGKETYNRNLEQLPSTNAKQLASLYFFQSLPIGLFVSIIMSVILRKQPKP